MASFAHSVSENGQHPAKLIDAIKMLILIQEEEYATGAGVGGHVGLLNRFVERWGCQPHADPVGFLSTCSRLSLVMRDITVRLTTKGSRLLGSIHRILQDWYGFHMMSDMEQLLYQSQREMEFMDSYEAHGYETSSLPRALSFLEKGYRDLSERLQDYIVEGMAVDQIRSLLEKYRLLEETIAAKRAEGFEPGLPIVDRVERAKASTLQISFDAMAGVLAHQTGRAMSEMNLISKNRFYSWLNEVFDSDVLLDLASDAGDLVLPVSLPAYPGTDQLEEFLAEFAGRQMVESQNPLDDLQQTCSLEADLDEIDDRFEEEFVPYIDFVLSSVMAKKRVTESSLLEERQTWGEALMTAAAAGESVTKELVSGTYSEGEVESGRFSMTGELVLTPRQKQTDLAG